MATPNPTHYQIVKDALLHGKHVFCEKPLTLKTSECNELKKLASENNLKLHVEYTFTFSKALQEARQLYKNGFIGDMVSIEMSNRHLGRFGGGSVYWLLGSHMLSILDMFTCMASLRFCVTDLIVYDGEVETGAIDFEGAIIGHILLSLNYPSKEVRVIFYGENGTMIYDAVNDPSICAVSYERLKWTVADSLPKKTKVNYIDEKDNLKYAFESFYNVLCDKEQSNVDSAIKITSLLERLHSIT